nr:PAS domain-containing protein [uncultured Desulfuromonas sp.]
MKAPMEECYCRSLSSENIEKAYDFCSGDYKACAIFQNVFRAQDVVAAQVAKDACPVIGLFTGSQRLLQLQSRQELSLQVLELLESNPSARNMFRDFIFMLRNFCSVNDITLYILDGDNHLHQEIVGCQGDEVTELVVPKKLECLCGLILEGNVPDETLNRNDSGVYWTNDRTSLSEEAAEGLNACINTCCPEQKEGSLVLIPVHYQGRTVGVVRVNDPRADLFTRDDIRFLDGICSALSVIVGRARAERNREYAEMIVETLKSPIIVVDRDDVFRKANEEYLRWIGRSEAEVYGQKIVAVVGESLYRQIYQPLLERAFGGEQVKEEVTVDFPEHPATACSLRCLPHFDVEGSVDAVIIAFHPL